MNKTFLLIPFIVLFWPLVSFSHESLMKDGMSLFEQKEYEQALTYFEEIASRKNCQPEALRMASICNSRIGNFEDAEKWALQLIVHDRISASSYELYFSTLVDNGKYEKAFVILDKYKSKGFSGTKLDTFINDPGFWKNNQLDTSFHKIRSMSFNSYRSELIPAVQGDLLYFGNSTTLQSGGARRPSIDLYFAEINNDPLVAVRKKTLKRTNESFKDAYVNFSNDGKTVFLTKIDPENKLMKLYYGRSKLIKMDELKPFKYNSDKHSVGRATLSPDGTKLVFSSDRKGSLGKVDLWMCTIDEQWNLSEPVNLGNVVNTEKDDVLPYFVTNDRLYFASEGHVGYGRFDLYYSDFRNGKFQKPVNLGSPVNTCADDMGICYSEKHDQYFFASDREGNFDIYSYEQTETLEDQLLADKKNVDQDFYFAVQVMASRKSKGEAVKQFKQYMRGKAYEFALVKEDIWLKFRTGNFSKREQATQFAKNAGFDRFFVVQMSDKHILEKIVTN